MSLIYIKNYSFILFVIIVYLIFLPAAINAEEYNVVFNHLDGIGDDYGPGSYDYPGNFIFQDKGRLFDIKALTIFESKSEYLFRFSFSQLTDPWGAEFSFSLPLIELYIDNQPGGSNQLFHTGANVSLKEDFNWNKFLKISGWWVRIYEPDSLKEDFLDINELSLVEPYSAEDLQLNIKDNDIYLKVPKKEINLLNNSKLVLLVGSFDPFGYDYYRSLSNDRRSWQIYSESELELSKAPRVLDILVPAGKNQKEILNSKLPQIPYLIVQQPLKEREKTLVDHLMPVNKYSILILFSYIIFVIFVIYKFNYKRNS